MKFLTIDPNWLVRAGLEHVLKRLDPQADIFAAGDLASGLRIAAENPDLAVILVDPGCSGSAGVASSG